MAKKKVSLTQSDINAAQKDINASQDALNDSNTIRLIKVEEAVIQINHFTVAIEKLELPTWKAKIDSDIGWLKVIMGTTALAALGQLVISLIRGAP